MNCARRSLKPDFLIIGAAKCGTTSLCDDLARHPGIFISDPKEIEYFCRSENYGRGVSWYESHFASALPEQLCGEGSTHYSDYPAMPMCADRIASDLPDVKLIYLIRDPVKRTYSGWLQKIKNQDNFGGDLDVPREFTRAIREYRPLIDCGDYRMQLGQYLKYFDRSRIHVMLFEDYISDRPGELSRLGWFLGFDPAPLIAMGPVWSNESSQHFERQIRTRMAALFMSFRAMRACKSIVPKRLRRGILCALSESPIAEGFRKRSIPDPMSDNDREFLWNYYRPSIAWMEQFLGRELTGWKDPYRTYLSNDSSLSAAGDASDQVGFVE